MNIFGSFTFGSLIKTFLPGVVWLIAICILEADWALLNQTKPALLSYAQAKDQSAMLLAFPAAIFLGLMSNVLVFMGINDCLVRNPVRRLNPKLFALYDDLEQRVRERYRQLLLIDNQQRESFGAYTDVEIVMLTELELPKLAYVREQYWYHLEFQMNLVVSLVPLMAGIAWHAYLTAATTAAWLWPAVMDVGIFVLACALLIKAARKNYTRHISKMLSLMVGFLSRKIEADRLQFRGGKS